MAAFLSTQLDFILFCYGMSFILLGATCVAIARMGGDESWAVLGLFGFLHGTSEWLDLSALVISDTPGFALVRTAVMTASFVVLMEFARREAVRLGVKAPGPWLHVPLLALVVIAGAIGGAAAAGDFARYIFGFLGGCATSWLFFRLAQRLSGFTRRLAICAAAGFAAYAVAAGIIVPAGSIWPATVLNQDWFARVTGLPIQLPRGMLACWLAFSIWSIWGQQRVAEVSSQQYARFLRQQYKWTLLAMAITLVAGWSLTEFLGGIYRQNVQREARGEINLLASRILTETDTIDRMAKVLASSRSVRAIASGVTGADDQHVQATLNAQVEGSGAGRGYILSTSGKVIVSSDAVATGLAEASDYSSAPYFRQSMAGAAGYDFGFDPRSGEHAYYASYPIRAANGTIAGVAVLEQPLGNLEADLRLFDRPYFLINASGAVVLTNRPQLKLRTLWPVPGQASSAPPGAANDQTIFPSEISEPTWTEFGGERVYAVRRDTDRGQWSLVILNPIREIYASRVLGIIVTLLVAIMILIYQFARERSVHDNVQIEQRMQLQDLARDLRFQASTDPLTGLFNRLKFNQALDGEMQEIGALRYAAGAGALRRRSFQGDQRHARPPDRRQGVDRAVVFRRRQHSRR